MKVGRYKNNKKKRDKRSSNRLTATKIEYKENYPQDKQWLTKETS